MNTTVRTNHHAYDLKCWYDLPNKQDFDYLHVEERRSLRFVQYKGEWYDVGDMEGAPTFLSGWDQFQSDSFFSGILIRYIPDSEWEQVICGTYFS